MIYTGEVVVPARFSLWFTGGAIVINYRDYVFFRVTVERTIIGGNHNCLDRTMRAAAGGS